MKNQKLLKVNWENLLNDLNDISINLEKAKKLSVKNEAEILKNTLMQNQIEDQNVTLKRILSEISIELKSESKSAESLKLSINKLEKSLHTFEEKVGLLNENVITSRQERDKCQKAVQDMRIKLIELESRRGSNKI